WHQRLIDETEHGVELVDGAVAVEPRRRLRDPVAADQRRLALVAASGVDAIDAHGGELPRLVAARRAQSAITIWSRPWLPATATVPSAITANCSMSSSASAPPSRVSRTGSSIAPSGEIRRTTT